MPTRIVAGGYGSPDVLRSETFESTDLKAGEVRVAVKAVGVNPYDVKSYSGVMGSDPSRLPIALGGEASGVVTEIRSGASDVPAADGPIVIGDEVIVFPAGATYATELVVSGEQLVKKPTELSFEGAAGLMLAGATAVHTLLATTVRANDTVLIHGASGGVGTMAIQLAVGRGARVIGTASESRHEFIRSLGAIPVTYGAGLEERVRAVSSDVDVALDYIGTDEALSVSLELVKDQRRIATIANFNAGDAGVQIIGTMDAASRQLRADARFELLGAVRKEMLTVYIDRTYPFADAAEAHRYLSAGHAHGKVVLTV